MQLLSLNRLLGRVYMFQSIQSSVYELVGMKCTRPSVLTAKRLFLMANDYVSYSAFVL